MEHAAGRLWPPAQRTSIASPCASSNHVYKVGGRVGAVGKQLKSSGHFKSRCKSHARERNQQKSEARSRVFGKVDDSPADSSRKKGRDSFWDSLISNKRTVENKDDFEASRAALVSKSSGSPLHSEQFTKAAKKFLFHAEGAGQVRALVDNVSSVRYVVDVQVDVPDTEGAVLLHWGLFRSDSADWVLLDPLSAPPETKYAIGKTEAMRTPLLRGPTGLWTIQLEFDMEKTPLYVHFVLYRPALANKRDVYIRNSRGGNFCIPVGIGKGQPEPLGSTWKREGVVNFALFSKNAGKVILCLYKDTAVEPSMEIDLEPSIHRTGDIWHVELESIGAYTRYGYRCKGDVSWESGNRYHAHQVLLDPYAKALAPFVPGQEALPSKATVLGWLKTENVPFDWEDDAPLWIPFERLVLYNLNVAGFTANEFSNLEPSIRGTFDGIIHKVPHLISLGVNAVILEPVFAHFDHHLHPFSFFCPAAQYGPGDSLSACTSLKRMVKQLHKNGIEVILDVVFSHTAEGGDESPNTVSFRGIDNSTFYILNEFGREWYRNTQHIGLSYVCVDSYLASKFAGCFKVLYQIVDSLRYWVEEFHVDGFHFVNGSALVTGPHGQQLTRPPVVEAISFDPILASTKLIVDCSSPFTRAKKSQLFPHWRRWRELNNCFRDDVRRFIRGDPGQLSAFATQLCGSGDLFANGHGPSFSVNFVTSPYGFTLADLVTYSDCDGASAELSWNCGEEGPSEDPSVMETRVKQVRNFIMALLLSDGMPVLNMGDEYGHSTGGVVSLEDNSIQFMWDYVDTDFCKQISSLIHSLVGFRLHHKDLLERNTNAELKSITWHGIDSHEPQWELNDSSFLGAHLHADKQEDPRGIQTGDLFIAFNAHRAAITATLPAAPKGMTWYQIADTSLPHPDEFRVEGVPINLRGNKSLTSVYELQPNSSVVLEARQGLIVSRNNSSLKFPAKQDSEVAHEE